MNSCYQDEPPERAKAIKKLEGYLRNPGRFSILMLGLHGTGKTHWLTTLQQAHNTADCLTGTVIVNAGLAMHTSQDYWEEQFEKARGKLLVVEDIDKLSKEMQEILFEGMSTGEGGKFGFEEKKYELRIAFTSIYSIKTLRDSDTLSNKFFDRIAQFIVELPSYVDIKKGIWADFKKSWKKMHFKKQKSIPIKLKGWLEFNSHKFNGQFRDLDKIAINWHNYRLIGENEEHILDLVTKDFSTYLHYPEHSTELPTAFYLKEKEDFAANLQAFKKYYKSWLTKEYGSLKKGAKHAGKSDRTMEGW